MGSNNVPDPQMPQAGEIFECKGHRLQVVEMIATGPFSDVYKVKSVENANQFYAMKVEKRDSFRRVLKLDAFVLTALHNQPGFPKILVCGRTNYYDFIVMQYIGQNLSRLRRAAPNKRFNFSTAMRIASQTLDRIEALHNAGFLNRDVKASNFAIGIHPTDSIIYMFDFGLSRRYRDEKGNMLPPRKITALLGTIIYASLASHEVKEQCRRDDLESWFYMCVEMLTGYLPWEGLSPMEHHSIIADWKRFCRGTGRATFLKECPEEFDTIFDIIISTGFYQVPDYWKIRQEIAKASSRLEINLNEPFDWQQNNVLLERADVVGEVGETDQATEKMRAKHTAIHDRLVTCSAQSNDDAGSDDYNDHNREMELFTPPIED